MKKGLREIIIIFLTTGLALGSLGYLTVREITNYATSFDASGYILDTSDSSNGALVNQQYYFNQGEAYSSKKSSDKVSFTTVNGDAVSVDPACFIHYSDNSMSSFAKTVILDTDDMESANISYYSISKESVLQKQGDTYVINSAVDPLQLKNFIWKISESQYMIVSETITLHVDENSYQRFNDYIQVQYKESGVAYIVNQEGTYSTVSSDAYLELANGIRIYLGSKNITDSEGILLSLTQMIVNSEDNIEIVPDEEFKKEKDVDPKIVVEANDGADGEMGAPGRQGGVGNDGTAGAAGEAGLSGDDGEGGADGAMGADGSQGKTGATGQAGSPGVTGITGRAGKSGKAGSPGTEGDPGVDGTSSETAGVIYVENEDPEYAASIVPTTYGMTATITYDLNSCIQSSEQLEATYVYIRNSATGKLVWQKTDIGGTWSPSGTVVTCDTLSANTNYTFGICACYTNALDEAIVDETVLTQLFATESIGLDLKSRYVTDKVIAVDLQKNVENSIKTVTVVVTDSNNNFVGYLEPSDANNNYNLYVGSDENDPTTFDIDQFAVGSTIPLVITDLDPDTTYKLQVRLISYTAESGLTVSTSDANACSPMTLRTLRTAPTIGKPDVSISQISKSFVISPKDIVDPYNGIVSYTYDIYNASAVSASSGSNLSFKEDPVLSVTSETAKSIKVKVDETTIVSGKNYVARVIAHFNNNSSILEYSSPLSDSFSYNPDLAWPSGANSVSHATASTLEGTITITDTNGTAIPREDTDYLTICIAPVSQALKNNGTTWDAGDMVELTRVSASNFADNKITISYEAVGLQQNTRYTLYAVASRLTTEAGSGTDVVLFTENVSTTVYDPISMNLHDETPVGDEIFAEYVRFYSPTKAKEDAKASDTTTNIWGDMSNISGKAMGYVEFELYAGDLDNCTLIGTTRRYADNQNGMYGYDLRRNTAVFDYNMTVVDGDTTTVYEAYTTDNANAGDLTGFKLTAADFGDPVNDDEYASYFQNLSSQFVIKAKVYDYTYGRETTGGKSLWRDSNVGPFYNPIPSGKTAAGVTTYEFAAEFTLTAAFPSWTTVKQKANYSELIYKNLGSDTASDLTLYKRLKGLCEASEKVNSNYPTDAGEITVIDNIYKGQLDDSTSIGVRYTGPSSGLAGSADKVRYTVYESVEGYTPSSSTSNTGTCTALSSISLADSGWLDVSANNLPDWYFLIDASIGRGKDFYIVTSVKLATGYGGHTYPEDYYAVNKVAANEDEKGIDGNGKDVDGLLCTKFCLLKQSPTVNVVQKNGTPGGSITYLFSFKDFDKAFVGSADYDGTNADELYFYQDTEFKAGFLGTQSTGIRATANTSANTSEMSAFEWQIINVGSKKWGLKWTQTENDTTYQLLQIDPYASVLESKNTVTILDGSTDPDLRSALAGYSIPNTADGETLGLTAYFGDDPQNQEGRVLTLLYYFFADEKQDFLTSDIRFQWSDASSSIDYTMRKNLSEYTKVSDNATSIVVGEDVYYIYKAELVIDLLDYPDLVSLPGKSGISVTVNVYSETGQFGIGNVGTDKLFTIQMRGAAGQRLVPDGTLYTPVTSGSGNGIFRGGYDTGDASIPGCYQFMTTSQLAKYYYIDPEETGSAQYKAMQSSYSVEGLQYIPRAVGCESCAKDDITAPGGPVINMFVEVVPGYSSAVMKFTVDSTNTNVDFGNQIKIFYAEKTNESMLNDTYANLTQKAAQSSPKVFMASTGVINSFSQSGTIYTTNLTIPVSTTNQLKANTQYAFRIYVDTDTTGGESFQYNKLTDSTHPNAEYFKTLERIAAKITGLTFNAAADGTKSAVIQCEFKDVQWMFFDDSATNTYRVLDDAYLVIRRRVDGAISTVVSGSDTASIIDEIRAAYPDQSKQEGVKATFTYTKALDWSPSNDHIMDDETDYFAELMLVYVGGHVDVSDLTKDYITSLNGLNVIDPSGYTDLKYVANDLPSWDSSFYSGDVYLSIVPETSYDYEEDTSVLTFSITGMDEKAIFFRSGGSVQYTVTLLENNVAVSGKTFTITRTVTETGFISPVVSGTYSFNGLDESTNKYRLLVSCDWDANNDGNYETGTDGYVLSTNTVKIPGKDVEVSSLYFNPNVGNKVTVMGTNLDQVTSITYNLYVNSSPVSIEAGTLNVGGGSPRWTASANFPGAYDFMLGTSLNPANTYQVVLEIRAYKPEYGLDNTVSLTQWWRPSAAAVSQTQSTSLFNRVVAKITDFFKN